jgi:peptidase M23-like protein
VLIQLLRITGLCCGLLLLLPAALAQPAQLSTPAPSFSLPLRCTPGTDCWIANHVDLDPGPGVRDYACARMSYNAHNGTDFALRDLKAMADGVPVLAAAAGRVRSMRNDEPDISVRERSREAVAGRECGNGVLIEHPGGYQTQYCHLRRGSVTVRAGAEVAAGDPIGLVGLSGLTEYPHLHWTVRHGGRVLDPFRGPAGDAACGVGEKPLWAPATLAALPYSPRAIYNFGVSASPPVAETVRRGEHRGRDIAAGALIYALWMEAFAVKAGDMLEMTVDAPDGKRLLSYRRAIERDQARIFYFTAKKRDAAPWPAGRYVNRISLGASAVEFGVDVR